MVAFDFRGPTLPQWTRIHSPTTERPYWHETDDGSRHSIADLLAGQDPETADKLARLHAQSIANLVYAAFQAGASGDDRTKRRLIAAAGLLADQMIGHRPSALIAPRR